MQNINSEYLSKSTVGSSLAFRKSPSKFDSTNDESSYLGRSTANTSRKDWSKPDYQNIKKIPH